MFSDINNNIKKAFTLPSLPTLPSISALSFSSMRKSPSFHQALFLTASLGSGIATQMLLNALGSLLFSTPLIGLVTLVSILPVLVMPIRLLRSHIFENMISAIKYTTGKSARGTAFVLSNTVNNPMTRILTPSLSVKGEKLEDACITTGQLVERVLTQIVTLSYYVAIATYLTVLFVVSTTLYAIVSTTLSILPALVALSVGSYVLLSDPQKNADHIEAFGARIKESLCGALSHISPLRLLPTQEAVYKTVSNALYMTLMSPVYAVSSLLGLNNRFNIHCSLYRTDVVYRARYSKPDSVTTAIESALEVATTPERRTQLSNGEPRHFSSPRRSDLEVAASPMSSTQLSNGPPGHFSSPRRSDLEVAASPMSSTWPLNESARRLPSRSRQRVNGKVVTGSGSQLSTVAASRSISKPKQQLLGGATTPAGFVFYTKAACETVALAAALPVYAVSSLLGLNNRFNIQLALDDTMHAFDYFDVSGEQSVESATLERRQQLEDATTPDNRNPQDVTHEPTTRLALPIAIAVNFGHLAYAR